MKKVKLELKVGQEVKFRKYGYATLLECGTFRSETYKNGCGICTIDSLTDDLKSKDGDTDFDVIQIILNM